MLPRERVLIAINHEEPDRVPIHDSPWHTTIARWHKEGLPQDQSPHSYFGFEFGGPWCDNSLMLPTEVLEETDEYVISTSGDGAVRKNWKDAMSTPELLDFRINTKELWEQHKHRMVMTDDRVNWEAQRKANEAQHEQGLFITLNFGPGFTKVCNLVGPETLMIAMVEDPEWAYDMFMTDARLCADIAEAFFQRGFHIDGGWVFDDLGHKERGFFSPQMYKELLWPAHRTIIEPFKRRGLPALLHSCGYNMEFVPLIIECGFDLLQPLEVKAGNDMLALKRDHGERLAFMGGIDVRAMADPDPAVIEHEIASKIPVVKHGGGYIYHSDHSVPDNVSFRSASE